MNNIVQLKKKNVKFWFSEPFSVQFDILEDGSIWYRAYFLKSKNYSEWCKYE